MKEQVVERWNRYILVFLCVALAGVSGCATPDQEFGARGVDVSADATAGLRLDVERTLYFEDEASGSPVVVEPGSYAIEQGGDSSIRLTPPDGTPLEVEARRGEHGEEIRDPYVLAEESGEDEVHLVILLEDGTSLDAAASYTGIVERGRKTVRPVLSRRRIALSRLGCPAERRDPQGPRDAKGATTDPPKKRDQAGRAGSPGGRRVRVGKSPERRDLPKPPAPVIDRVEVPRSATAGSMIPVTVEASDRKGLRGVIVSLGKEIHRYSANGRRKVRFTARLTATGRGRSTLSVQAINAANIRSTVHRSTIVVGSTTAGSPWRSRGGDRRQSFLRFSSVPLHDLR